MSRKNISVLLSIIVLCFLFVVVLHAVSKKGFSHYQDFTRELQSNVVELKRAINLKDYSYYFAGTPDESIFLGNSKDQLELLIIDSSLSVQQRVQIRATDEKGVSLATARIEVDAPFFYIKVAKPSGILKGVLGDWQAMRLSNSMPSFTQAVATPSGAFVLQQEDALITNGPSTLYNDSEGPPVKLAPELPSGEVDRFSIMGMLRYCRKLNSIVFVYSHKDEYLVMDANLNVQYRASTINAGNHPHIIPTEVSNPDFVNLSAEVYEGFLFINSTLIALNETKSSVQEVSVIDVFDLANQKYRCSFYLPSYKLMKMRSFKIAKERILALYGQYLVEYVFNEDSLFDKRKL